MPPTLNRQRFHVERGSGRANEAAEPAVSEVSYSVKNNVIQFDAHQLLSRTRMWALASEAAFAKDWDNPLDAQYDDL